MSNKDLKFKVLAETFRETEETDSSLEMIKILANFFKKVSPEEAKMSAYLICGRVGPLYKGVEFQLAEKLVIQAIAEGTEKEEEYISKRYNKVGDLGNVVEKLRGDKEGEKYSIKEVFKKLEKIAIKSGSGSQGEKIKLLATLLRDSSAIEARYIARLVLGKLRLGVAEMTFLNALSQALTGEKKKKKLLEHAFNVYSDLGRVAYEAIKNGINSLEDAKPSVGVPIRMMLAQRIKLIEEAEENIEGELYVEYKYDGERAQIHIKENGEINLFSRQHENITNQYPDIVKALKKSFKGKNAIIEGEIVAIDKKTGEFKDFQILMSRRRKYNIEEYVKKIPVNFFIFDILFADNKNLMKETFRNRNSKMLEFFSENKTVKISKGLFTKELAEVEEFFTGALEGGAEGVMIKGAKTIYQAGSRGWRWIKYKKDYQKALADTFDLVVVGGVYGTGRRGGTYGSLLVASFDPESNKYYSFTKVGAGFNDEDLEKLRGMLDEYKISEKHRLVETEAEVDAWFEPYVTMEIMGAEITVSPIHKVAQSKLKKGGLALRFPRFLRWRKDKTAHQSTTPEEIYQIYKKQ